MKIYLIRHSESEDDVNGSYGGCADWKLTENGRRKVEKFRATCKNYNIEKFFCSPYARAYETANILNKDFSVSVEKVANFREINTYGVMCGVNKELAKELFAFFLADSQYQNIGYYKNKSFYGGEPVAEFDERVKNAWEYISKQKLNCLAVVTHGGVFRSTFKNVLNEPRKIVDIEDVACVELEYSDGKFTIRNINGVVFE